MQSSHSTRFTSPDPDLARAEELVEDDLAHHLDSRKHVRNAIDADLKCYHDTTQELNRVDSMLADNDQFMAYLRRQRAKLSAQRKSIEERHEAAGKRLQHLAAADSYITRGAETVRDAAGILDARQRSGRVRFNIASGRDLDVNVEG